MRGQWWDNGVIRVASRLQVSSEEEDHEEQEVGQDGNNHLVIMAAIKDGGRMR
jgi:hypothetical protein